MISKNKIFLKYTVYVVICVFLATSTSLVSSIENQENTVMIPEQYYGNEDDRFPLPSTLLAYWNYMPVDTAGSVGYGMDMVLDSQNKAHMSYSSFLDGTIKYARQIKDDIWDIQTVEQLQGRIMTAIAVDRYNKPHILYYDWMNQCLKYATLRRSLWVIETVDPFVGHVNDINSPAITIDSLGRVHIAYYNQAVDQMMYGRRTYGSFSTSNVYLSKWYFEAIDSSLNLYFWPLPSIAVDPVTNQVRVAYYGRSRLMHAVRRGIHQWETEIVHSYPGVNPSLAIGPNGLSVISYIYGDDPYWDDFNLMCARQQDTGEWICEVVDPYPRSGTDSSLIVDSNNVAHIVYIEYSSQIVTYAYRSHLGWTNEFVAQINEGVWGPGMVSIALDCNNQQPHIAFRTRSGSNRIACFAWRIS